jgi:hypothetical protein
VWNIRRTSDSPFNERYEQLVASCVGYRRNRHLEAGTARFFGPRGCRLACLDYEQSFDFDGLRGRFLSGSYAPQPGQPGHDEAMARLRELVAEAGGRVTMAYDTEVYFGRLS